MDGDIFAIVIVSILCGTAIIIVFLAMLFGLIRGKRKGKTLKEEDGKMIEDLWRGLQRMEDRVNNLETILLQRRKAKDFERKL